MTDNSILDGMRVVEVSAFVAAPSGGMALAQMGAEVIRIDPPRGGLDYRRWPVIENTDAADNVSLFWAGLNKHKKSVAIDFSTPEGKELCQQLITAPGKDAGMFLTNMPPRGWLDYEQLKQRRSDLIQLTVQGDRHGGSAVDYTLNPRLGLPQLTGPADYQGVVNHVLPAWDLVTGQMAASGLLAAERHRYRSGQGQHVKLPLEDVALSVMAGLGFIAEAERGEIRERAGNHLFGAFGRDFITADGQRLMVVGLTLKQWKNLVAACDLQHAMQTLEQTLGRNFNLEGDRFKSRDSIAEHFERVIRSQSIEYWAHQFDSFKVCWGKYQSVSELLNDPACSEANPMFARVQHPGIGSTLTPSSPLNFATGRESAQAAPVLGQHTEQVLLDQLGVSSSELGRLSDRSIVLCAS